MKTLVYLLLAGLLTTWYSTGNAANPEWLNLTNGNHITAIKEHDGFLWVGTKGGLTKIDQSSGEKSFFNQGNSALPSNSIEDIEFDSQGNIWIGTYDMGLVKYDGNDWELFNSNTHQDAPNQIYDIAIDENDHVWIGTTMELFKFDGSDFTSFMLPTYAAVSSILCISSSEMWLSWDVSTTGAEAVFHFDGSTIDTVGGLDKDNIYRLYADNDDKIWACFNGGLARKESLGWTVFDSTNTALPNTQVRSMSEDVNGNKYIGTDNGVYQFDGSDFQSLNIDREQINYLKFDDSDNLWIGSLVEGLTKYDGSSLVDYQTSNSLTPSNVYTSACMAPDGSLWFSSSRAKALVLFDGSEWTTHPFPTGFSASWQIQADALGNIWVTDYDDLLKYDGNNWTSWNYDDLGVTVSSVSAFLVTPSGEVWLGSYNDGLTHFDGVNWTYYNYLNSGLTSNTVFEIASGNNGKIYIGLHNDHINSVWQGGGLAVFDGNNFIVYNESNSDIVSNYISDIYIDGDSIWAGGDNGMSILYNGVFTSFEYNLSPIPLPGIKTMAGDHNGNIFFVGYGPVMGQFDGTMFSSFDNNNSPLRNFSSNIFDMLFDSNGNLWILSGEGVFLYKAGGVSGIDEQLVNSVMDEFEKSNIVVYPNPFQKEIRLKLPANNSGEFVFELFDMEGKPVMPASTYSNYGGDVNIDLPDLKSGIYIYRINIKGGSGEVGRIVAQ